ncbi:MAG: hypothetical protein M3Z36_03255 [Acidobacteriota bacterium]|nr:hypothetical protein [Acidobacteriota bacterium]
MKSFIAAILLLTIGSLGAQTGARKDRADDPDMKEIRDYRLTMSNMQKFVAATKSISGDAASVRCMKDKSPGNAPTLDAGEKILNGCAETSALIKKAGLAPREYVVMSGAIMADFLVVGMKKQGTIKEYPPSILPENAAFIEQNFDKLSAMLAPVMQGDKSEKEDQ